jgi:hypothetical protein
MTPILTHLIAAQIGAAFAVFVMAMVQIKRVDAP